MSRNIGRGRGKGRGGGRETLVVKRFVLTSKQVFTFWGMKECIVDALNHRMA